IAARQFNAAVRWTLEDNSNLGPLREALDVISRLPVRLSFRDVNTRGLRELMDSNFDLAFELDPLLRQAFTDYNLPRPIRDSETSQRVNAKQDELPRKITLRSIIRAITGGAALSVIAWVAGRWTLARLATGGAVGPSPRSSLVVAGLSLDSQNMEGVVTLLVFLGVFAIAHRILSPKFYPDRSMEDQRDRYLHEA